MLDLSINEIEDISNTYDNCWEVQGISYLFGTDDEMDEEWDTDLDNYIDDCLEIPKDLERYFDRELWKSDARTDGRPHSLGRYDGREIEFKYESTWYYAYRQ
ncbi:hypothetical protein BAY07_15500 [Elizabethkingia bruuniana]|nr:hypothetical protein BAY07_15500 [Elizabethkingia bruuniana]